MPKVPVLAYFYDFKEEELICKHLLDFTRTESYYFGFMEANNLYILKKEGILIDILTDPHISKDGRFRNIQSKLLVKDHFDYQKNHPNLNISLKTNFYLIELQGPLLESWKQLLTTANIQIIEKLQNNIYKVYTTNSLTSLQNESFINSARQFEPADKELLVKRSILSELDIFEPEEDKVAIYDIRIHQEKIESILHFLEEKNIDILATSSQKIRVLLTSTIQINELSQRDEVSAIEEYILPQLHNDKVRLIINIEGNKDGVLHTIVPYQGEGEIIGVADTGIDLFHPDLKDCIYKVVARGRVNDPTDTDGHGTHVAGSILGNGNASDGLIKGVAPKAKLFFQSILDSQGKLSGLPLSLYELFMEAYKEGVRIHNNSWGALAESEYLFNSLEVDEFVYHQKDMLLVISAGNDGTAFKPRNSHSGFVDWLSISSPATAKNALTVGASRNMRTSGGFATLTYGQSWPDTYPEAPINSETVSGNIECIAGFSSRGPCGNESRIKPDVVAPGTDIASTKSSIAPSVNFWGPYPNNRSYAFMGGTSMAAPIVTGFAALVREYYIKVRAHLPSAALLKATIINGTRKLQGQDALADHPYIPNFHQGFGCIDMQHTLPNTLQPNLCLCFIDSWHKPLLQFNATGQRFLFSIDVKEGSPLRLCLTWTDPPGRGLQNNLNLLLMHKAQKYKWTGNEEIPRTITAFDRDNNVEIIRIEEPHPGEYLIAVQAVNIIFSPQDFALIITGALESELAQL